MNDDIKKGLMGVTVDETAISKVMPEINSLTYRGYAAQDLCSQCQFEEVAYLILNGELPNKKQYKQFLKGEIGERNPPSVQTHLRVAYRGMGSTYGPTPLHKKSMVLAQKMTKQLGEKVKNLSENKIKALEQKLKDQGAPYIQGQGLE